MFLRRSAASSASARSRSARSMRAESEMSAKVSSVLPSGSGTATYCNTRSATSTLPVMGFLSVSSLVTL